MRGLIRHLARHAAHLGHIVQQHHGANGLAGFHLYRRGRQLHQMFGAAGWPNHQRTPAERQRHAGRQRLDILLCAQEVTANLGGRERVRALHPDTAAGLRVQMHHVDRKAGEWMGTYFLPIT